MFAQATLRCSQRIRLARGGGGQHESPTLPRLATRPAPRTATRRSPLRRPVPPPHRPAPLHQRLARGTLPRGCLRRLPRRDDLRPRPRRLALSVGRARDWTAPETLLRPRLGVRQARVRPALRRGNRRRDRVRRPDRAGAVGCVHTRLCPAAGVAEPQPTRQAGRRVAFAGRSHRAGDCAAVGRLAAGGTQTTGAHQSALAPATGEIGAKFPANHPLEGTQVWQWRLL